MTNKTEILKLGDEEQTFADAAIFGASRPRLRTVAQVLTMPEYAWATNSYLRHVIFEAEERFGSGGVWQIVRNQHGRALLPSRNKGR